MRLKQSQRHQRCARAGLHPHKQHQGRDTTGQGQPDQRAETKFRPLLECHHNAEYRDETDSAGEVINARGARG